MFSYLTPSGASGRPVADGGAGHHWLRHAGGHWLCHRLQPSVIRQVWPFRCSALEAVIRGRTEQEPED